MPESDKSVMSVIEHLDELRNRIIVSGCAVAVFFILTFIYSHRLIDLFKAVSPSNVDFIQVAPGEVFIVSIKLAVYAAVYLSLPVILYQIILFILPGLRSNEKKYFLPIVAGSFLLFTTGLAFGYFAALPLALGFLLGYGSDVARNVISIENYIGFCTATVVIMGFLFQLPLLIIFLALIKILDSSKLTALWKHVVVGSFILGAVLTPSPDPFAQIIVAAAILLLFFASIAILKLLHL